MQALHLIELLEVMRPIERRLGLVLLESGLTLTQFRVLLLLENNLRTPSELSSELGVSKPLITGLLKDLERAGLVALAGCKLDRRSIRVHLTAAGKQRLKVARLGVAVLEEKIGASNLRSAVAAIRGLERPHLE